MLLLVSMLFPGVNAVVGTHAVAGVLAETHAAADVSDVVGPAVAGVLNCSMMSLLLLVLPSPMPKRSSSIAPGACLSPVFHGKRS